ncbi:histidine kinase [Pedobacter aquatilis]|uniref:sensor histidine kinase n=1 Tax=Pedobacter aquatilis TaxID=351343 RepID=UPI00292FDC79|nr:histidine kinase [Pedobacter aquatilis]
MFPLIRRLIENKWYREALLFVLLCLITIINDRTGFVDMGEMANGLFVFITLYIHLQIQRFFILPFLVSRHYLLYAILVFATIILFSFSAYYLDSWLSKVGWYDDFEGKHWELWFYYFFCCLLCIPALLLVFYIVGYYRKEQQDGANKMLLKEMELELLKAQLNPHFLFNSMNNLYGISLEKPDEVPDRILQLSGIMRYQLELSGLKKVTLGQDLAFIEDYIAIEKERLHERCDVSYNCSINSLAKESLNIAPMILITFIENCFKHVELVKINRIPSISIDISFQNNQILLSAVNSSLIEESNNGSTKTGLINVRRRLNILYPDSHRLKIEHDGGFFKVMLRIQL